MSNPFFTLPVQTILQDSGLSYVGAKVYFYASDTTTLETIYQDVDHVTPAPNPVTCNAAGRLADDDGNEIVIYPQVDVDYKIRVESPNAVELWTIDPVVFTQTPVLSTQTFVLSGGQYYAGIDQNNQTGTSYTIQNSDWAKVVTYNNSSSITVTLPDPTGSTFVDKWFSWHTNIGTGTVTINASSNINGSSSYVLYPNYSVGIVSNGSTYYTLGGNAADIIAREGSVRTIASGVITVSSPFSEYTVLTEGGASSDDLDTINGGVNGKILILRLSDASKNVVLKHNTGNIFIPSGINITLDTLYDTAILSYDSTNLKWVLLNYNNSVSKFRSTAQTLTAGTETTIAHGLGQIPDDIQIQAVCTSADLGYSVGDRIAIPAGSASPTSSPTTFYGFATKLDATNIKIRPCTDGVLIPRGDASDPSVMTLASWQFYVNAFYYNN